MEVGISSACFFGRMPLEDVFEHMRYINAGLCEVFLNTYSEYEPEFIDILYSRMADNGLRAYSVHSMSTQFEPQLFSIDVRQRRDARVFFKKVLAGAKKLGAKVYVMHGPATMRGAIKNVNMSRIGPMTAELAELADDEGVRLSWENVSWCLFSQPQFASMLIEAARSEKIGFTLDIKQAARSGYSYQSFIDNMGDRIVNVHVCDYRIDENGRTVFTGIGDNGVDFAALKKSLDAVGYKGPAIVEVYSDTYGDIAELGDFIVRLRDKFSSKP